MVRNALILVLILASPSPGHDAYAFCLSPSEHHIHKNTFVCEKCCQFNNKNDL